MSGEGEGRRQGRRSGEAAPLPRGAGTPPLPHAAAQPAFYSPHHAGFQPWLPTQFSAMASYGAPAFYLPPPSPLPYGAPPSPGAPGGDQRFLPLAGMVMGLPSEATTPRGWGGMQFEQQVAHVQPGDYSRVERPRPPPPPPSGRRYGRGGGHGHGQERRGRVSQHADLSSQLQLEELLLHLRRLPRDAPLHPSITQALHPLDGRGLAQLIRELGRNNLPHRGAQLFDLVRSLGPAHELAHLLDEYAYTSMVANCGQRQALDQALGLMQEMQERGIPCNVHTYSALMNVAIKCGQYRLALDVYRDMRAAGCPANVVTFNTLCDVYGKSGQWEEALAVLEVMRQERVQPVTRTFNTIMIACNTSGQWQEALRVHEKMVAAGQPPNTTTFNALISAHSKAGDLPKVLQTFEEMVSKGCERSVITYSSLISACEKAGEWKLALQLFEEMRGEGCTPNVISYNSLIAACAQGAQWEKAGEVFEAMQAQGCRPDVVTYTALIQAYERGGQWRRALAAFEDMRSRQCTPDSIILNIILDVLWETGVAWAQRRAAGIFRDATEDGLIRQHSHSSPDSLELNLHSTTVAVALLSLHNWLAELCARGDDLPARVSIIAGKGKAKDAGHSIIKETVTALLRRLEAPFQESADATAYIGRLEATGGEVSQWLAGQGPAVLSCIVPLPPDASDGGGGAAAGSAAAAAGRQEAAAGSETTALGAPAGQAAAAAAAAAAAVAGLHIGSGGSRGHASQRADKDLQDELAAEARAAEAFSMAQYFEKTHNLNVQMMRPGYLAQRPELARLAATLGTRLRLPEEAVHDAVLLLDRAMSVPLEAPESLHRAALAACLLLAARQAGLPDRRVPEPGTVAEAAGVSPVLLGQVQAALLAALQNDTASISGKLVHA